MSKKRSKMLFAISLTAVILSLVITFEVFYVMAVDHKLSVKAITANSQDQILNSLSKDSNQLAVDLTKKLSLEYATNESARELGLMHRNTLCSDCGMFFVFEKPEYLNFWMKNTLIPLDITFISQDGVVINTQKAAPELNSKDDSQYPTYSASAPAQYVLETNQGWTEKNLLKNGDKIDLNKLLLKK